MPGLYGSLVVLPMFGRKPVEGGVVYSTLYRLDTQ